MEKNEAVRTVLAAMGEMSAAEAAFEETPFVAPCLAGGRVRARVGGIVRTFRIDPADFAGWGIFQARGGTAHVVEVAELPLIDAYLKAFPKLRLRLARQLDGTTWLAYPGSEADMGQRFGSARPTVVHLVAEGVRFEPIIAHSVGGTWWFAETDRRADPMLTETLREAFRQRTAPDTLAFPGSTPEMRTVYDLAAQADPRFEPRDERRLRQALQTGGGELRNFHDRGSYYLVEWTTASGEVHTSAITKDDLTVVSSGICLSGRDHDFDLQSLVGVIEQRY